MTSPHTSADTTPPVGIVEWFRPGEYDRVEKTLSDLKRLQVNLLRTGISRADSHTPDSDIWFDWLLPRLSREVEVLPCFTYTPPSSGIASNTAAPSGNPRDYADFLDQMVTRYGNHFEWVELWNEPDNLKDWDWRMDPNRTFFCDMISAAAHWMKQRGKKTVLGGLAPTDQNRLDLMCRREALADIDAVGIHGFFGTREFDRHKQEDLLDRVQAVLHNHPYSPEIWITEAGYSTWRHDEFRQLAHFRHLVTTPARRIYWSGLHDLHPEAFHQDGFHEDEKHYHFGLVKADGTEKLLFRTWADSGIDGVNDLFELIQEAGPPERSAHLGEGPRLPRRTRREKPVLITGGAGFIGTNLAHRLLSEGKPVLIYDNISRPGVELNLRWLWERHGERIQVLARDVRNPFSLREAVRRAEQVFHFAAQVAVTTSLDNPMEDFEINLRGTLNLLEALRAMKHPPPLVFTSTNKVYGALEDIPLRTNSTRVEPADRTLRRTGVAEDRPLDLHSPYGCSKGAADQYVLDYTRVFSLPCVVFRMSCIYGPHQFGTEDQGWVAHFIIRTLADGPLTLYGDGKQVRDVLFVEDLLNAFQAAQKKMNRISGQAFNIGGGPENTLSLLELLDRLKTLHGGLPEVRFSQWRTGDQRYYVSHIDRFREATGWAPTVGVGKGIEALYRWLAETRFDVNGRYLRQGEAA
ncbi:MAG: NAD-dependent epimerase/dehydratase family protein [Desulfococcaceae bacterium]